MRRARASAKMSAAAARSPERRARRRGLQPRVVHPRHMRRRLRRLARCEPHPRRSRARQRQPCRSARDGRGEPLTGIVGTGPKLWSLMLAELLLVGDPGRERWMTAGAGMIAVDSLIHNFLHRTGSLRRCRADHRYGPACYTPGGCAEILRRLAATIDARAFNPAFPACFPRWVQHSLWQFSSEVGGGPCNGRRIDDRGPCRQRHCPAFPRCDRVTLHGTTQG